MGQVPGWYGGKPSRGGQSAYPPFPQLATPSALARFIISVSLLLPLLLLLSLLLLLAAAAAPAPT